MRARWHECQRRETAQGTNIQSRQVRGGRDEEWKNRRASIDLLSVSQSISQQASKQASKTCKRASKQAHSSLHKGVPPGPNSQNWECPPCSRQITNSLPQKRSGGQRTVEGGRVENRGSRIDEPTPWRPTPRARYERELNSIEQKPTGRMCHAHVRTRRKGEKGG